MDSTVSILDLGSGSVTGRITVGMFPEGITAVGGNVYVAVGGFGSGENVVVIDPASDRVTASIPTGYGPTYLAAGSDGRLYVSCVGYSDYLNPANDTDGRIVVIDPAANVIVDSLIIPGHPGKISVGSDGTVYVVGPGSYTGGPVLRARLVAGDHSFGVFIPGTYYAIGVDDVSGEIYAGDAKGFSGNGVVAIHREDASRKAEFECGIGPTVFFAVR
jgi:DNA-binding beta-propeller fold protein YncE